MRTWSTPRGTLVKQVMALRCNVYLVSAGALTLLFDTSWRIERRPLTARLERIHPGRLHMIILSHTHFDHVGNVAFLKERFGTKVLVHEREAGYLLSGHSPLPGGTRVWTRALMALQEGRNLTWFDQEPCTPDLLAGDTTDLDGTQLRLIHTPGHTAGSVSLVIDGSLMLTGDALFGQVPWTVFPPFADDIPKLFQSWERMLDTGCDIFLPAHGTPVSRRRLEKEYRKRKPMIKPRP